MSGQKSQQAMRPAEEALRSLVEADVLALWQSLEQRGSDEKNRMIAAVTLALGLAGACVVPALEGAMDGKTTGGSLAFGALSLAASTVGLIFVGFFAHHATRNYLAVDHLFQLHPKLMHIRDGLIQCNPVALLHQPGRLERLGRWIAENKGTVRLFPRVGRIFDMMAWLSVIMMTVAIVILVMLALGLR
jgi:hypothetical protein